MNQPTQVEESCKTSFRIVETVVSELGSIDVLVNNAGIVRRADLLDYSEQDWDDVIDVNLRSGFLLSQAVARHMVETKRAGSIINVASMLSFQGGIRVPAYTAFKHGIAGLTKAMAKQACAARHHGQRHRSRLYGDGQYRGAAR